MIKPNEPSLLLLPFLPPMKYVVVTKSFLSAAVAFTLMIGFHLFDMRSLFFYWPLVWEKFELWRLITGGIVMGPPSFHVRNPLQCFLSI